MRDIVVSVSDDPGERARAILAIAATPKHMVTLRLLAREDWASVDDLAGRSGFSKRVVYRVVKDLVASGVAEFKTHSGRRVYRVRSSAKWILILLEEPQVCIRVGDDGAQTGPSESFRRLSSDDLAVELVRCLSRSPDPLGLTQLSARAGAWAIDVKERLNHLIREGLVHKQGRHYILNPELSSEIARSSTLNDLKPTGGLVG